MGFREEDEDKERLWVQRFGVLGNNGMQGLVGTGSRMGTRAGGRACPLVERSRQTCLDPEH